MASLAPFAFSSIRGLALTGLTASIVWVTACTQARTDPATSDAGDDASPSGGVVDAFWCPGAAAAAGCSALSVCGVCVPKPGADLTRTTDTREFAANGSPNLDCFAPAGAPKPAGISKMVTMSGYARIFANGADSSNLKIEIYTEKLDPQGHATGELGTKVADAQTAPPSPDNQKLAKTEVVMKGVGLVTRYLYPFTVTTATIPTEVPLIIHTSTASPDAGWFNLYEFNLVAFNDRLTAGAYVQDVRALSGDDYAAILEAAYSRPPTPGKSAIAGEVHDCADVRMSNASVALSPVSPLGLLYLSENEDDPLPDKSLRATGKLGLYAVGGLAPGSYTMAAAGVTGSGSSIVALGSYAVQTFADSVSVFTFRGVRPWQLPTPTK